MSPRTLTQEFDRAVRDRLLELAESLPDEDTEASPPSAESRADLVDVLAALQPLSMPSITLDADGQFWARWRKASDCYASLRFMGEGCISYALATPDTRGEKSAMYFSGRTPTADVGDVLRTHESLRWIFAR